jgi:hypothetical protein
MHQAKTENPTESHLVASPPLVVATVICGLVIALVMATRIAQGWPTVHAWNLADNDDAMRVLQVRDWLAGQSWYDVRQYRLNPPAGGDMHWSRLADLPLALTTWLAGIFVNPLSASRFGAFITPPLLGGVYLVASMAVARRFGGLASFLPAFALSASAIGTAATFMPGRVDHHGLQLVLFAITLWGLTGSGVRAGVVAGLAMACSICIGLEALPLQAVLIAFVAIRWAGWGVPYQALTLGFGIGFGLGMPILFGLTVAPSAWALPVNDAVGRGHVILAFLGGGLLAAATRQPLPNHPLSRWFALGLVGVTILPALYFFREVVSPPYGQVDPILKTLWLNNVSEAKPVHLRKVSEFLSFAAFPLMTLLAVLVFVVRSDTLERRLNWVLLLLVVSVSTLLMMFWQVRVSSLAGAACGIACAGMIGALLKDRGLAPALLAAVCLNPIVPTYLAQEFAKRFEKNTQSFRTGGGVGCYTQNAFATLAQQPKGIVVAPIDMGARLLLTTHHSAMAAPYHRNNIGNLAAYRIFLSSPDAARAQLRQLGASYVAVCVRSAENQILANRAPQGLMAQIKSGRPPSWLKALPRAAQSDIQAYQIIGP